jgi:hypothetical protein
MAERLNGGPYVIGPGQDTFIEYWWGERDRGEDRHLAYACAHPIQDDPFPDESSLLSYDQRALCSDSDFLGGRYWYGFTVHNDRPHPKAFDIYATTP